MGQRAKHVIYKDGSWVVQVNGHAKSAKAFSNKYEAIKAAGVSKRGAPVIVHGKHGQIFHSFDLDSDRGMRIRDVVHEIVSRNKSASRKASKLAA